MGHPVRRLLACRLPGRAVSRGQRLTHRGGMRPGRAHEVILALGVADQTGVGTGGRVGQRFPRWPLARRILSLLRFPLLCGEPSSSVVRRAIRAPTRVIRRAMHATWSGA